MNAIATKNVSYGFANAIVAAIANHEFNGINLNGEFVSAEILVSGETKISGRTGRNYNDRSFLTALPHETGQAIIDYVNSLPVKVKPVVAAPVVAAPVVAAPSNAGLNNGESELAILVRREIAAAIAEAGIAERSIVPVPATDHIKVVESPNVDQVVMTLRPGNPVELLNENGTGTGVWAAFKGTFTDGGKPQWEYFTTNPAK